MYAFLSATVVASPDVRLVVNVAESTALQQGSVIVVATS